MKKVKDTRNCPKNFLDCGFCYSASPDRSEDSIHSWRCRNVSVWAKLFGNDTCWKALDADIERVIALCKKRNAELEAEKREVPDLLREIKRQLESINRKIPEQNRSCPL